MQGNLPVRFRGEEVRATSPPYPTVLDTVVSEKRSGLLSRFPRPPTRTQTGLQSQALSRLLHPDQLPERPAAPQALTQAFQLGWRLRLVDVFELVAGTRHRTGIDNQRAG